MHGEIRLESEIGRGTVTTFMIPFRRMTSLEAGDPSSIYLRSMFSANRSTWSSTKSGSLPLASQDMVSTPQIDTGERLEPPPARKQSATGYSPIISISNGAGAQASQPQNEDRKNIQVLVVEDKLVQSFSDQFRTAEIFVVHLSRKLLSRPSKSKASLSTRCGMAKRL